jgi:predicted Na+-dependent transporter
MYFRGATGYYLYHFANLSFYWLIISVVSGIYGFTLFFGRKEGWLSSFIYSLPICVMIAEGIELREPQIIAGTLGHRFLFQTIFNFVFAFILYWCFSDKKKEDAINSYSSRFNNSLYYI